MDSIYEFHLLEFHLTIKTRSFFESATIHRDRGEFRVSSLIICYWFVFCVLLKIIALLERRQMKDQLSGSEYLYFWDAPIHSGIIYTDIYLQYENLLWQIVNVMFRYVESDQNCLLPLRISVGFDEIAPITPGLVKLSKLSSIYLAACLMRYRNTSSLSVSLYLTDFIA